MNIPERVKIGPYVYDVIITPERVPASNGDGWAVGQIDYKAQTITIVEAAPAYMFATYVHECLHAIADLADVDLSERQTTRLANWLTGWIIDNEEPS